MNNFQVETKNINQDITHFTLDFISLILNQSAIFRVNFYNNENQRIQKIYLTLQDEEYSKWGNDDSYITDLICQKFSLILKPKIQENNNSTFEKSGAKEEGVRGNIVPSIEENNIEVNNIQENNIEVNNIQENNEELISEV